ncbi:hypothetical protein ENU1_136830 [Entamoeba nuttalli P19]|uniref:Uncharacterized protein n=2 Tax=Entamoeba nuttalli TaxID=412467 RepID=K2HT05_ENTNP|nr:hypothetical protein ENU1_136830 [Entamoeba nuttalli P19]EKE39235.1 hypothetical protein ENU1_136830 [Entamoeba nuttalli P19]|eukprot:XP_008858432.1 hypothetical protein ENU1_136830 [Entamoeba nuttalli P19]
MLNATQIQRIIPYVSLTTVKQLIQVNKKVKMAIEEMKVIPLFKTVNKQGKNLKKDFFVISKLFPQAIAATIDGKEMTQLDEEGCVEWIDEEDIIKFSQLRIINLPDDYEVIMNVRKQIVGIETKIYYYDEIDFDYFPLLYKLCLDFDGVSFDFREMFINRCYNVELVCIKGFTDYQLLINILKSVLIGNRVIIEVNENITREEVEELSNYCIVTLKTFKNFKTNEISNKIIVLDGRYYDEIENDKNCLGEINEDLMYLISDSNELEDLTIEGVSLSK